MAVIRQQTQVFNKPVGVRRINTGEAELWETIKKQADEFTRRAYNDAAENAQKVGGEMAMGADVSSITTLDPLTGRPKAMETPEGMGSIAEKAYRNVITQRYEDSIKDEMNIRAQELALRYQYKPEEYAVAMSQHIASMAENADGMYKTFIEVHGSKQLASNKLSLQKELRDKVRLDAGNSIIQKSKAAVQTVTDFGKAGNITALEEMMEVIEENVANYQNGEASNLLKAGSAEAVQTELEIAGLSGYVSTLISQTENPTQRAAIITYIKSGGVVEDHLDNRTKLRLSYIKDYLDVNTINSVATNASGLSETMNSTFYKVQTANNALAAEQADRLKAQKKLDLINNNAIFNNNIGIITSEVSKLVNTIGDKKIDERFGRLEGESLDMVAPLVQGVFEHYQEQVDFLNKRMADEGSVYTPTEFKNDVKALREAIIKPLLFKVADIAQDQGNLNYVKGYIFNPNPKDFAQLTNVQQTLLETMVGTGVYDYKADRTYISNVLTDGTNQTEQDKLDNQEKLKTFDFVQQYSVYAQSNLMTDDTLNMVNAKLKSKIGKHGYTVENYTRDRKLIEGNAAAGVMSEFAKTATSSQFLALIQFVETATGPNRVGDVRGMTNTDGSVRQDEVMRAKKIVDLLGNNNPKEFIRAADSIKINISNREDEEAKINAQLTLENTVRTGTGIRTDNKLQNAADTVLSKDYDLDVSLYSTYSDVEKGRILKLLHGTPSKKLLNGLEQLISGVEDPNAQSYFELFVELDNFRAANGKTASRLNDVMSAANLSRLDQIQRSAKITGIPVIQIAQQFAELERDGESKNLTEHLGKTPTEFVSDFTEDPTLSRDLLPVVKTLSRRGDNPEMISDFIDRYIEKKYLKSEFVLDPNAPFSDKQRSQYALSSVFPDYGERDAFIASIEKYLSGVVIKQEGTDSVGKPLPDLKFSMYADKFKQAGSLGTQYEGYAKESAVRYAKETSEKRQIFLIPDPNSNEVSYIPVYKELDENNKPTVIKYLLTENEQGLFLAQFTKKLTDEYRANLAIQQDIIEKQEIRASEDAAKKEIETKQKIKILGPMAKPQNRYK
jgi:hypothetical protein